MIARWKIFYDDGSVFSSQKGPPAAAPLDGVQGILEWDEKGDLAGRYWGQDFYQWTGDGWRAGNQADLERWLRAALPTLKYGRWCPRNVWQRIRAVIASES